MLQLQSKGQRCFGFRAAVCCLLLKSWNNQERRRLEVTGDRSTPGGEPVDEDGVDGVLLEPLRVARRNAAAVCSPPPLVNK